MLQILLALIADLLFPTPDRAWWRIWASGREPFFYREALKKHIADIEAQIKANAWFVSSAALLLAVALLLAAAALAPLPPWLLKLMLVGGAYLTLQVISVLRTARFSVTQPPEDGLHNAMRLAAVQRGTRNFVVGFLVAALGAAGFATFNRTAEELRCQPGFACQAQASPTPPVAASVSDATASAVPTPANPPSVKLPAIDKPVSPPPAAIEIRSGLLGGAGFVGLGLFLLAGGIALTIFGPSRPLRTAGIVLSLDGIASGWTGIQKLDFTAVKLEKLIDELHINLGRGADPAVPTSTLLRRAVTIGPFAEGEHRLADAAIGSCVAKALAAYGNDTISGWVFVGRVDKRELNRERAGLYGSNQALAMARANWVAQQVTVLQPGDLSGAILAAGGAQRVGLAVSADDRKGDRAVDLFVLVSTQADSTKGKGLPKPQTCPSVNDAAAPPIHP